MMRIAIVSLWPALLAGCLVLAMASDAYARDRNAPEVSHDGLHRVDDRKVDLAYVDPEADFTLYESLLLADCSVAFRKNWQHHHRDVNRREMERIKSDLADLFRKVFEEVLEEKGGYRLVEEIGKNVLIVRPLIIDLDVSAPDVQKPGSRNFVTSSGSATLLLELYDSVSGDILARAIDRKEASSFGRLELSTRGSNLQDSRRMFKQWARLLRQRMDEFREKNVE